MKFLVHDFDGTETLFLRSLSGVRLKLMLLYKTEIKTAFRRCRHILKTVKNVAVAKLELAFS